MRDFSGGKRALVEVPAMRLHGRRLSGSLMRPAGAAEALEFGRLDVEGANAGRDGRTARSGRGARRPAAKVCLGSDTCETARLLPKDVVRREEAGGAKIFQVAWS